MKLEHLFNDPEWYNRLLIEYANPFDNLLY